MTNKHFIALAAVLRDSKHYVHPELVLEIAKMCAKFNPDFEIGRFMSAALREPK